MRWVSGSRRTSIRESERLASSRPGARPPSVPMTSSVVGSDRIERSRFASCAFARCGRRPFASSTPFENARKPRKPQRIERSRRPTTARTIQRPQRRRRLGPPGTDVDCFVGRFACPSGTLPFLRAMNLPLDDVDLAARSRERFGLPVGVENDASAATLAEWRRGAGRGTQNLVMLTLGTGVGGGIVIDGGLFRGWAELGHIVVQEGGELCTCGGHGHLEVLASGSAGDRMAQELWGADADAHALVDRAQAGDADAQAALARIGRSLGAAIASLVNVLDPELVVVGGGFGAAAGDLVLEPAREAARADAIFPANGALRIVPAELGSEAGLVGAGLVAFEALDGVR